MKTANDPRHLARVLAVQFLFSKDFNVSKDDSRIKYTSDELSSIDEIGKYDVDLFNTLTKGVVEKETELDEIIVKNAPQWPLEQIKKLDLEILRIALYEGFLTTVTPPKVAIDEAIELAKDFGGSASDKFVNGVLGAIYEKKEKDAGTTKED